MKNIEDIYELSPMQQGMLFHTLYAPTSGIYLNQLTCTVNGNLDIDVFKESWQNCLNRHTILRTSFHWENLDKPVQVVNRQVELSWAYHDWRHMGDLELQNRYESFLAEDRRKGFQLNRAPLIRCTLIRCAHDNFRFTWTHHHILMDGWCFQLLVQEMLSMYRSLKKAEGFNLAPTRPYRDFIRWHQARETHREGAQRYWENELRGFDTVTPLIRGQAGAHWTPGREFSVHYQVELPGHLSTALETQSRANTLTLNTLVQGAWSLLLSRYSATPDIMYGITVSGRPPEIEGIETMIGLFINTLPLRVQVEKEKKLVPWLQEFQLKQAERETYSYCSLSDIQTWSQIPHGTPMFDTLLIYENYPVDPTRDTTVDDVSFTGTDAFEQSNYPLVIIFLPGKNLTVKFHYDPGAVDGTTIQRLSGHLLALLQDMSRDPERSLSDYTPLTADEKHLLLNRWNATDAAYPDNVCIHEIYERRLEKQPDQAALFYKNRALTYRGLNCRANQLAHYLRKLGAGPDVIVGLEIDRSLEMIVGLMGILKAGGAYMPLDPTLPVERLRFMMDDAGIAIIVTRERQNNTLSFSLSTKPYRRVSLDTQQKTITLEPAANLAGAALPTHLAYVIFTSGTTGRPKGVLLNHHGVCNFIGPKAKAFDIHVGDRMLQFASLNFDASVSEIFAALLNGATLVMDDKDSLTNPPQFWEILKKQRVNIMKLPPVILRLLPGHDLPDLKTVISAGERCTREIVEKWGPGRRFLNAYGPTETSVISTIHIDTLNSTPSTIGKPLANTRVYILDANLQPVPLMVPGELFISGIGLARGYLNRPELTLAKFIPNPYWKTVTARETQNNEPIYRHENRHIYRYMYRTGDMVCWQPGGEIEFLGRSDHQVKIRGFRIEPGEIEAQLVRHPGVKQAAVVVLEEQRFEPQLAAYVVPEPGEKGPSVTRLRLYLSQQLPHYMVPSLIKISEALPLTNSRKIDRRRLAQLPLNSPGITREEVFIPPQDAVEFKLCKIWEEILQVQPVGIRDNFFDLGGHSLLAVRILGRIGQVFGKSPSIDRLFAAPTVAGIARELQEKKLPPGQNILVTFNAPREGGTGQPVLFCIHPAAASVICYRDLARSLGEHLPCSGIEDPGLLGLESHRSIEEMARHYILTLKQVQPTGPYYLMGWSFGGIVAFEMAGQLKKQGEPVALLTLLDTAPPSIRENLSPGWESTEIISFAQRLEAKFGQDIHLCPDLSREQCRELSPERVIQLIMETAQLNKQIQDPHDLQHLLRWLTVFKTNCRAASVYNPQPYPGKIVFFYAEESYAAAGSGVSYNQWEQWAREGIEAHSIPGNHFTMLEIPQVHVLARELQRYLVNNRLTLSNNVNKINHK